MTASATDDDTDDRHPWHDTELYRRWHRRTQQGDPDDYVIAVTASSKTGVSGSGKSTVLTVLGESTDTTADGFDATETATIDARELAYEIAPDAEPHSALVADEMQGGPGAEGMNARRHMTNSNVDAINAILYNRDKCFTVLIGAQVLQMLDTNIYPVIDSWLLIRRGPSHPKGPLLQHHEIYWQDYKLKSPQIRTPTVERLTWPRVPHDNPNYRELERMKQEAKDRDGAVDGDGDNTLPDDVQAELAQEYRDMGKTLRWIDENAERVTYSREWIRQNTVADDDD